MICVLGSTGQLGSALMRVLGDEAVGVPRGQVDLAEPGSVEAWFADKNPRLIINCAAYNEVDRAEIEGETAWAVNATAVGRLADIAERMRARFITYSTDYVFDGHKTEPYVETDPPNPLSVYGRSKLQGELRALEAAPGSLVIRTSALLSTTHANFASRIADALEQGPVRVVRDQITSPTKVADLAEATLSALEKGTIGVLHLAGSEPMTWSDLATRVAELRRSKHEVVPVLSDEFPRPAARPAYSALGSERNHEGLPPVSNWLPQLIGEL